MQENLFINPRRTIQYFHQVEIPFASCVRHHRVTLQMEHESISSRRLMPPPTTTTALRHIFTFYMRALLERERQLAEQKAISAA
jgi:hypothetical protein